MKTPLPASSLRDLGSWATLAALLGLGAACGSQVISGDDGGGGQGAAGGTMTTSSGNGQAGVTTGGGMTAGATSGFPTTGLTVSTGSGDGCPADPGYGECSSASGPTAFGCDVHYCDLGGGPDLFKRECDSELGTCTCQSPDGSCTCAWNGNCDEPCCGYPLVYPDPLPGGHP